MTDPPAPTTDSSLAVHLERRGQHVAVLTLDDRARRNAMSPELGDALRVRVRELGEDRDLRAVTHVDGTARVQTVNATQNPQVHALLQAFRQRTGAGVLCNTSLNFNGRGFINRTSDLHAYCVQHGVDAFVCNGVLHDIQR